MFELYRGRLPLVLATAGLLSGCGGGSGDDDEADNQPPVAAENCTITTGNRDVTGFLEAADSDHGSDELLFSLGDNPNNDGPLDTSKGRVALLDPTTGEFRYAPDESSPAGPDTFRFRVDDPDSFTTGTETVVVGASVMPLGDSITAGILGSGQPSPDERVGYRGPLYERLADKGFEIDLVGSERGGQNAEPPIADPDHESYGGATARNLAFGGQASEKWVPRIFDALDANPADIVLLHIGTNEIHQGDPEVVAGDIEEVLDEIDRWENSPGGRPVTLFLAEIIERTNWDGETCNGCSEKVEALNDLIRDMPERRPGDDLFVVNQHAAVSADCDDGDGVCEMNSQTITVFGVEFEIYIHPNAEGYADMADTWASALTDSGVLPACD